MASNNTVLPDFDPPGFPYVDDILSENKIAWSKTRISDWMQNEITATNDDGSPLQGPNGIIRTPLDQFFNGTITPFNTGQTSDPIHWTAFPKKVQVLYTKAAPLRWQIADASRIFQDEYLEWSLNRDADGNITNVVFTCEGPEYWQFLADNQQDTLIDLYKSLNPEYIQTDDDVNQIFITDAKSGVKVYNPNNVWNNYTTTGTIAHLIHPANTLSAEVDIAAQATVVRKDQSGNDITDEQQLIKCSQYGNPNRNSDPHIGGAVNSLVRSGNMVSIANPVALYIYSFDTSTLSLDIEGTGNNTVPIPDGTITFTRGNIDAHMGLRLQIQVPQGVVGTGPNNTGRQLTVSDLWDSTTNLNTTYGAQFADYIQMSVSGVVATPLAPATRQFCPESQAAKEEAKAVHGEHLVKAGRHTGGKKRHFGRSNAW